MKLSKIAVLLSGAALSASVFAADNRLGIPNDLDENVIASSAAHPQFNVDETKPATQIAVRFGDENDTSWLKPAAKPAFVSHDAAPAVSQLGIPHDLDENALAMGYSPTAKSAVTAGYSVRGNGAGL